MNTTYKNTKHIQTIQAHAGISVGGLGQSLSLKLAVEGSGAYGDVFRPSYHDVPKTKHYNDWQTDYQRTKDLIMYVTSSLGMAGQLVSVESCENDVYLWLDKCSGIDFVWQQPNESVCGIASRIQIMPDGKLPYNTFSVRYSRASGVSTEYQKRIDAIKNGDFYPKYTIQAYYESGNELLSAAIIKTTDLYAFVKQHPYLVRHLFSENEFLAVEWDDIIRSEDYPITIYQHGKLQHYNIRT